MQDGRGVQPYGIQALSQTRVSQGRTARDLNIALSPQRDGHCAPGGLVDQIFLGIVRSLRWLEGASK